MGIRENLRDAYQVNVLDAVLGAGEKAGVTFESNGKGDFRIMQRQGNIQTNIANKATSEQVLEMLVENGWLVNHS